MEEYNYHGILFTSDKKREHKIDKSIESAAAVLKSLKSVLGKQETSFWTKLSVFWSIYLKYRWFE